MVVRQLALIGSAVLATIFVVLGLIGRKFQGANPSLGRTLKRVGGLGALLWVVVCGLLVYFGQR